MNERPSITCPQCNRVSYATGDIEHKFCGRCGYHEDFKHMPKLNEKPTVRKALQRAVELIENYRMEAIPLSVATEFRREANLAMYLEDDKMRTNRSDYINRLTESKTT